MVALGLVVATAGYPIMARGLASGVVLIHLNRELPEGEEWMQRSLQKAPNDSIVHYNAGCFYALAGQTEKSLDCLEQCRFGVGNLNREWLKHDSDLESVRDHPRFQSLLDSFPA